MDKISLFKEYLEERKKYPGKPVSQKDFDEIERALKVATQARFPERYAKLSVKIDEYLSYMVILDNESVAASIVNNEYINAIKRYIKEK